MRQRVSIGSNIWTSWAVIGAVLMACIVFPATASEVTVVTIGGTGSALGVMKQLAREYEKTHPGTSIRILPSLGSTAGIKAVLGGGIDLALASRPLAGEERKQGAVEVEYARSPFVFAVNQSINKKDITTRELEGIYSNPKASWPDGSRIRLILRPEKDIDSKMLRGISPGMEVAVMSALSRPGMIIAITDQESTDALLRTPGALGGATLSEIVSENRPVKVLSFNGIIPGIKTIADGSYPLVKSFYLVTTQKSPPKARQFADFILSPSAVGILKLTGNLVVTTK